jgi:hypothetical protein
VKNLILGIEEKQEMSKNGILVSDYMKLGNARNKKQAKNQGRQPNQDLQDTFTNEGSQQLTAG